MKDFANAAKIFKVLNHPVRLAILEILGEGEQCVCHLEAHLGLRQSYISQHLMLLREMGLVQDRRDGWNIFYRVVEPKIFNVMDAMSQITDDGNASMPHEQNPRKTFTACECPKCKPEMENAEKLEWLKL
jgi:DNA-binding transcriptional ArsR family regulator